MQPVPAKRGRLGLGRSLADLAPSADQLHPLWCKARGERPATLRESHVKTDQTQRAPGFLHFRLRAKHSQANVVGHDFARSFGSQPTRLGLRSGSRAAARRMIAIRHQRGRVSQESGRRWRCFEPADKTHLNSRDERFFRKK